MGARTFPGSRVGMGSIPQNVNTFGEYVEAYFADVQTIYMIELSYKPDYTATISANTADGTHSGVIPISKEALREMLSGIIRELHIIDIRFTSIDIAIQRTGVVTVTVNW